MVTELQRVSSRWPHVARISWSAIFAGLAVGLAVQMLLTLLGVAAGLSAVDPQSSEPVGRVPAAAGVWTGVSMLISAFMGGFVAARMSGLFFRSDGVFHGFVTWGVTTLAFVYLATTAVGAVLGGTFSLLGQGLKGVGQGVAAGASATGGAQSAPGIRGQLESILRATEKPELQPETIQRDVDRLGRGGSASRGTPQGGTITDDAMAELQQKLGAVDREAAVNVMMNKMGFSRDRAEQAADQALALFGSAQTRLPAQAREAASQTVSGLAATSWWLFFGGVLSLLLSLAGGAAGVGMEQRIRADEEVGSRRAA